MADPVDTTAEKRAAAQAAAELVEDGMLVGLGTGSTVAPLLPALAARDLRIRCVSTSPRTLAAGRAAGLEIEAFDRIEQLDIAIDGADQVTPDGWLIKGGGGAHVREKIVAAAAERFVVIVSSDKPVERLRPPVPLELAAFGMRSTMHALGAVRLRAVPQSPDGGWIADLDDPIDDPAELAARLDAVPGVVGHGLFEPALTDTVLIARGDQVESVAIG